MREDTLSVSDASGRRGQAWFEVRGSDEVLVVRFEDGSEETFPREALRQNDDGSYRIELGELTLEELSQRDTRERRVIPLVKEEVRVDKRERQARVVVRKEVEQHTEMLEVPLRRTEVEVKRVPVNRVLEEPAEVRTEGDVTIIPVMIERPVVYTEIVLVEEIHLIRRELQELHREEVEVREEKVEVEREPLEETGDA